MLLTDGLELGLESEAIDLILPPLWGLAEVALQAGDPSQASRLCQDAIDRATAVGERILFAPFVVTGVRAAQAAGRPLAAATFFDASAALLAPIPDVAGPALDHGRGLIALAEGATGIAREALERAVAGWDAKGRIWEGDVGAPRPRELPHQDRIGSPMRCPSPWRPGPSRRGSIRGLWPIAQTRSSAWRVAGSRSRSHGAR